MRMLVALGVIAWKTANYTVADMTAALCPWYKMIDRRIIKCQKPAAIETFSAATITPNLVLNPRAPAIILRAHDLSSIVQ